MEILLIHSGDAARVFELTAVAAELEMRVDGAQVDVAAPVASAPYAALGESVRRVIAVNPPETGDWSDVMAGDAADVRGWGDKLLSAAKKATALAGSNLRNYRQLINELRVTQYDVAVDFESNAYTIAVSKMAKTQKIVAFDPSCLESAAPGGSMMAHEVYKVPDQLSPLSRMRHLCARAFDFRQPNETAAVEWRARRQPPPASAPAEYLLLGANVPAPLVEAARQSELPVLPCDESTLPAEQVAGLAQNAALVVGNGAICALALSAGAPAVFAGGKKDAPPQALPGDTPSAVAESLAKIMAQRSQAAAAPSGASAAAAATDAADTGAAATAPSVAAENSAPKLIKLKKT